MILGNDKFHTRLHNIAQQDKVQNDPFTLPRGPTHRYRRDQRIAEQSREYPASLEPTLLFPV